MEQLERPSTSRSTYNALSETILDDSKVVLEEEDKVSSDGVPECDTSSEEDFDTDSTDDGEDIDDDIDDNVEDDDDDDVRCEYVLDEKAGLVRNRFLFSKHKDRVPRDGENINKNSHITLNNAKKWIPIDNDAQTRIKETKPLLRSSSSLSSSNSVEDVTSGDAAPLKTKSRRRKKIVVPAPKAIRTFQKEDYISRRVMTATQERWNGLSILPSTFFCIWYFSSGAWWKWNIDRILLQQHEGDETVDLLCAAAASNDDASNFMTSYTGSVLPPLPMMAISLGILLHAPFSFIHHFYYCVKLPPGEARFDHWSRRLDQAFIHVASALLSYGTSGSPSYFCINTIFCAYCFQKLVTAKKAAPVQNQLRILLSMIMYTGPILVEQNDPVLFGWVWLVLAVSVYIFATYPIKGWSHCAFHLVVALAPPLLMYSSTNLEMSKEGIIRAASAAAQCSSTPSMVSLP